jgi:nitrous oxidase accessory protein NosD
MASAISQVPGRIRRIATLAVGGALAAALLTAPAVAAADHHHLVVAAGHGNDANPCTADQPCATIGHAIDVAAPGATIDVRRGTYAEQVIVQKRLTLNGQHAVIDAAGQTGGVPPLSFEGVVGYGLLVFGPDASGSVVHGFTVQHAIGEGILVAGTSKIRIDHNTVRWNDTGVGTDKTAECQGMGDVPGDCGEGLHFVSVMWSTMTQNVVENNVGGILITDEIGPSAHNVISHNVSRNNAEDCGITLPSHNGNAMTDPSAGGVYDNLISHNVSEHNGGAGVGMFTPFPGTASYDNQVIDNTLRDNGEAGVAIHAHDVFMNVSGNVIRGNRISGNGVDPDSGSGHPTGIALFSANVPVSVTVSNNHIANEYWGIFTAGSFTTSGMPSNHYAKSVVHHTN